MAESSEDTGQRVLIPVVIAGVLAAVTAVGATMTWGETFLLTLSGTDTDAGKVTLAAALIGLALCGLRLFSVIRDMPFIGGGLITGMIAFMMPGIFIYKVETDAQFNFLNLLQVRLLETSSGVWFTLFAAGGFLIVIAWQFVTRLRAR